MVEISTDSQAKIIAYLALEGFGQASMKTVQPIIQTWLGSLTDADGEPLYTLSTSRPHPLLKATSATKSYKQVAPTALAPITEITDEAKYDYGRKIKKNQTSKEQGRGTKTDASGVTMPVRTIKAPQFNYNGWMFRNILRLANGQDLHPNYVNRVNAVASDASEYLAQFDVEPSTYTFNAADAPTFADMVEIEESSGMMDGMNTIPITPPETSEPVEVFVPSAPTPGAKIKNPATLENTRFPTIVPPTAEEEVALSKREWERQKKVSGENPAYDFAGEVLVNFTASRHDESMQPISSLISGGSTAPVSADDFFSDMDEDVEDENTPAEEIDGDAKWFATPEIQFSFKKGSDAYFRVLGDATYEGQMWPVTIGNFTSPARVSDVKLFWNEPNIGTEDAVSGFKITLRQEGKTMELVVTNGKCKEGFQFNRSKDGYNLLGGMAQPAAANGKVVIYGHGVKGFAGLLNVGDDIEPSDTLTWSDLNNSGKGGDYNGEVSLSQSAQITSAIQTQISRFYGNPDMTNAAAYWKNWTSSGGADDIMGPISGGNNIIFNFKPEVTISADIKLYEETNPEYLQPKSLKLIIEDVEEGAIPTETGEIGVIAPTDGVWDRYVEFVCLDAKSSDYFPTYASKQEFMLPGDEKYLSFIIGYEGEDVPIITNADRVAGSIQYITYDKSSVTMKEDTMVVPAIRLAIEDVDIDEEGEETRSINFVTIPDAESDFYALDINGETVGGTVEGGQLAPPDPQIVIHDAPQLESFRRMENVRRTAKQSPAFTITEDDAIVTNSLAWLMGSEQVYYVVATNDDDQSVLVRIDLTIPRRGE